MGQGLGSSWRESLEVGQLHGPSLSWYNATGTWVPRGRPFSIQPVQKSRPDGGARGNSKRHTEIHADRPVRIFAHVMNCLPWFIGGSALSAVAWNAVGRWTTAPAEVPHHIATDAGVVAAGKRILFYSLKGIGVGCRLFAGLADTAVELYLMKPGKTAQRPGQSFTPGGRPRLQPPC